MKRGRLLGGFALIIALSLGVLLAQPAFSNPARLPPAPDGLVAVLADKSGQPLDLRVLKNPAINGVALQIHWSDLEPAKDKLDWSKLDGLLAGAEASGKWVQLLIFPGFFTPRWALEGVDAASFPIQYGPGKGTVMPLPMPWDAVYLGRWTAFLKLVSGRYGASPAFRVIAADGPTSVSAETTLPNARAELATWQQHRYTQRTYVGAWRTVLQAYAADFPKQYVSISGGAGTDPILRIDDQGRIVAGPTLQTKQKIVDLAVKLLGGRLALQYSNLDGNPDGGDKGVAYMIGDSGRVVTGFQLRTSARAKGMGADGDGPLALRRSIDNGIRTNSAGQHVNYIEIYAPDVLAEEMQPVLRYGARLFGPTTVPRARGTPCATSCG